MSVCWKFKFSKQKAKENLLNLNLSTETTSNAYYIGMTSPPFKSRFNQHKHSFRTETRRNSTALSQFTWNKNCGPTPNLKWEIIKECKKFSPGDKMCDLCTSEKLYILKCANDVNNINLRNDVGTRCCHVRNTRLGAITWILRGTNAAKWSTLHRHPQK